MPMTDAQINRLRSLTPGALICALRLIEAVHQRDEPARLVRAWLIEEAERRWPAASAAVEHAYDEDAKLLEQGVDAPEVDYVGILLGHVPADVLAAAPAELPALLRPLFDGLGIAMVNRPTVSDNALPDADERALQRGLGPASVPATRTPPVEHNGTTGHPCTECGHYGTGQVPGCTCKGCQDDTSRRLA